MIVKKLFYKNLFFSIFISFAFFTSIDIVKANESELQTSGKKEELIDNNIVKQAINDDNVVLQKDDDVDNYKNDEELKTKLDNLNEEKDGSSDILSKDQIEDFRKVLKTDYREEYSKNIRMGKDRYSSEPKKSKKMDIKVVDAKSTKLGSSRIDMQTAYRCFMDKKYELSIYYYQKSIKENNKNYEGQFGLATSYLMLKQYDQAITEYVKLISNNYSRKQVINNLFVALQYKTYKEALGVLTDINAKTPGYADILAQIGVIYIRLGDNTKAIATLNRANELSPYNSLISYNLGLCYDKEKNYDFAKHFYEQAIRNDISEIISSSDYSDLLKRVEQIDKKIKEEIEMITAKNKKNRKK